ncbi:MAG: DNA repair protein RecN, partial [Acutalibacteraceae bacterium]|nr:DNA repair protein RecN [Acutalibacteraceae bacterium]
HYLIEKDVENDRTFTKVSPLDDNSRKNELARIIGGAQITDTTVKAAAEMIELADSIRKSNK